MLSTFYILKLLVIKNVKSHLSMWYMILLELLIAIVTTILLISANRFYMQKSEFERSSDENMAYNPTLNLSTIDHVFNMSETYFWGVDFTLVYTPQGEWQHEIAKYVGKKLNLKVKYVPQGRFYSYLVENKVFCGLKYNTTSYRLPKFLNYSLVFPAHIRSEMPTTDADYKSEDLFWQTRTSDIGFHRKKRTPKDQDIYYKEGFLSVQNSIFQVFLKLAYNIHLDWKMSAAEYTEFPISIQQMPFPKYSEVLSIIPQDTFWVEVIFFVSFMLPTIYLINVS